MLFYYFHFQEIIQKICFLLENLDKSKNLNIFSFLNISDWYSFQLNERCNSFALSWVDKVTNGTYNFISVIANLHAPVEIVITQVHDNVKMRLISQLIHKKYWNKAISTFCIAISRSIFCVIYLCIIYFVYAVSKWCTTFKYYSFISFMCFYYFHYFHSWTSNCYFSFSKYLRITIIT